MTSLAQNLTLESSASDVLMPMHLRVATSGHIVHAGPTLLKLRPDLVGQRLLEIFQLKRPRNIANLTELRQYSRTRMHLQFREPPHTAFKAVLVEDGDSSECLINLSFGISIVDAISDYNLHSADFAPTDLAVEMLYLLEAKSTIMEESRSLNRRLQAARIAAEEQAYTDTLTGLKNRRALEHVLDRFSATGQPFGLVHLDLDYFKAVNDTLGHAAGDHVLQEAARIMVQETRKTDTLVRSGGDEFLLVLPDMTKPKQLMKLAQRLISEIERPIPFGSDICEISASAGITIELGDHHLTTAELITQSDVALYASKKKGKACATVFSEDLPQLAAEA